MERFSILHGDITERNSIISANGNLVAIDWEFAALGAREYDIAQKNILWEFDQLLSGVHEPVAYSESILQLDSQLYEYGLNVSVCQCYARYAKIIATKPHYIPKTLLDAYFSQKSVILNWLQKKIMNVLRHAH